MKDELSPTMVKALAVAKMFGGKLTRFPGGHWHGYLGNSWSSEDIGTSTVEALVTRGKLKYTVWQKRTKGGAPFPIEATVVL